jgi:hypothetical protein
MMMERDRRLTGSHRGQSVSLLSVQLLRAVLYTMDAIAEDTGAVDRS